MQKMSLLEMVQNIGSAMDLDEVNSITDTTESLQIAEVIKETLYEQFNNIFVAEHQGLFALESVSDLESPNYLRVPTQVSKIAWLRYKDYRAADQQQEIPYVAPEDFLQTQFMYSSEYTNVFETVDPTSGVRYFIRTDSPPTCFTMFDDQHVAFDGVDLDYETTLTGLNAVGYGTKSVTFELADDFVPPIDGSLFPLLLAEAKSVCFVNLKQVASSKEEQRARRQRIRMQNDQFKARKAQYNHWNLGNDFSRRR